MNNIFTGRWGSKSSLQNYNKPSNSWGILPETTNVSLILVLKEKGGEHGVY